MTVRVGVDVGGTFTDVCILDEETGRLETLKVSSTPHDPSEAIIEGVRSARRGRAVSDVVHGTTVATNTLLEHGAPEVALLVTDGFRDVLEIGRQERPKMYDFVAQPPAPLAPRRWRLEVPERMGVGGTEVRPPDLDAVREIARRLRDEGVESVAVCLLHSYANPAHERQVAAVLEEEAPELDVSLSSDLVREFKEYERMSTAVVNAYVRPVMRRYLTRLREQLSGEGIDAVRVMQSNGGAMSAEASARAPVQTVLSGPAGGAIAGLQTGRAAGFEDVISVDMGGTSFDISIATKGGLELSTESEIAGRVVKVPMIDIHTLGAGGGSIAWIDDGGGLRVGPESARAVPGPACYGRGGTRPTVTDANAVLGRLSPDGLLGGELALDIAAAWAAVEEHVAKPLGLGIEQAAEGIVRVVNAAMVKGMRYLSVERGNDPRRFGVVAFGGGGPVHAVELAHELGAKAVVVPPHPGLHSAVGLLAADMRRDVVQTVMRPLADVGGDLTAVFEALEQEAAQHLAEGGVPAEATILERLAELRYVGQGFELTVPCTAGPLDEPAVEAMVDSFHEEHRRVYGFARADEQVEIVNARATGIGRLARPLDSTSEPGDADGSHALRARRRVWFDGAWVTTDIADRALLEPGNRLSGPVIVEQVDTTTVVPPGFAVTVDGARNLIVKPAGGAE